MNAFPTVYVSAADVERRRFLGKPLFSLGRIVATPAALEVLTTAQYHPAKLLQRHQCGDWGELLADGLSANTQALISGGRLLSRYRVDEILMLVVTEAVSEDAQRREFSTLLLQQEY